MKEKFSTKVDKYKTNGIDTIRWEQEGEEGHECGIFAGDGKGNFDKNITTSFYPGPKETKEKENMKESKFSELYESITWVKHDGKDQPKDLKDKDLIEYVVRGNKKVGQSFVKDLIWNWNDKQLEKDTEITKYRKIKEY
jgi:hypothetical protein